MESYVVVIFSLSLRGDWVFTSKKVHHVCLLAQVDSDQFPTRHLGQVLNQTCLSNSRWSLNQDRLVQLIGSKELQQVYLCGLCIKRIRVVSGHQFLSILDLLL